MKLHPRTVPVTMASFEISANLDRLQQQYELTDVEMLRVLLDHQQRISENLLRVERHPDELERKADEG